MWTGTPPFGRHAPGRRGMFRDGAAGGPQLVAAWVDAQGGGRDGARPSRGARKAETQHEAASRITRAIYESKRFRYEVKEGESKYTENDTVLLTHFLGRLKGRYGKGVYVNCTDCASFVVSFSNLLGCELYSSIMGDEGFLTNPYSAIGCSPWTPPRWGWAFGYHEVAWTGECMEGDLIYDACLSVDGDGDPSSPPRRELLPLGMLFDDGSSDSPYAYRESLAAPVVYGYDRCIPNPETKVRRKVR